MFLDYQLAYGTSLFQMKAALIEKTFLGNHRCLKHSQNCAMHLPHLLSKLDSLPFYPWPDLSENMTSRNIKLCLLKRAPCEHPISGEKRWKENQFFKCKAFQFRNSFTNWFPSSTSNHQRKYKILNSPAILNHAQLQGR